MNVGKDRPNKIILGLDVTVMSAVTTSTVEHADIGSSKISCLILFSCYSTIINSICILLGNGVWIRWPLK